MHCCNNRANNNNGHLSLTVFYMYCGTKSDLVGQIYCNRDSVMMLLRISNKNMAD